MMIFNLPLKYQKISFFKLYFYEFNLRLIYLSLSLSLIFIITFFYANEFILYSIIEINKIFKFYFSKFIKLSFLILNFYDLLLLPLIISTFITVYLIFPFLLGHFFFFLITGLYKIEIKKIINLIILIIPLHLIIIPLIYNQKFPKILIFFFQLFFINKFNLYTIKIQPEILNYTSFFFQFYILFYFIVTFPIILFINQYFKLINIFNIATLIKYRFEIYSFLFLSLSLLIPPDFLILIFLYFFTILESNFYLKLTFKTIFSLNKKYYWN